MEDIKILEKLIEEYDAPSGGHIIPTELSYLERNAIENLIARNKELEYKLRQHISIEAHEQVKQLYIPKSKVKEKIEEINDETDLINKEYFIEILEELLKEN